MDKLTVLKRRLHKIGVDIEYMGNYPWIYIHSINGVRVKEKFHAEHGFTVMFRATRPEQTEEFTDIGEIFKLIRKYKK